MTDKEKIHQILSSLWKNDDSVGKMCYNQALQDVQTAIDSMQDEPVSEDLEKAAIFYADTHTEWFDADNNPHVLPAFKAGAKWDKEQMMAKAVDATVHIDAGGYPYIPQMELYDYDKDIPLAKEGYKYKVILIKEDLL